MNHQLDDDDWDLILNRIQDEKCTPFLGAGVNSGILPMGSEIAQEWARERNYPLEDPTDLVQVAQFLAVDKQDPMFPKEKVLKLLRDRLKKWANGRDVQAIFKNQEQPLGVLAKLPFPIYMTTNYDDLLITALQSYDKTPIREFCPWNKYARQKQQQSVFDSASGFEPTSSSPVVYHLHGHDEVPESLVLTEDDYLDFLVNISREQMLPPRIQEAFGGTSLMFIGYRLADWNFRVLFRGLVNSMDASLRRLSISVQLPPDVPEERRQKIQDYLSRYFGNMPSKVLVYWGTANQFITELQTRWDKFTHANGTG